jgi:hypothetical protein
METIEMTYKKTIAGPFGSEDIEMTPEEITARQAEENALPAPLPIGQQLNNLFGSLTPELQADFAPLKAAVKLELDQGNTAIALLIIQRATIPNELESIRQAMLDVLQEASNPSP